MTRETQPTTVALRACLKPVSSPWEEFHFETNKCPHLAGLLRVYVTGLQYHEDPDGDTVQHEV